MRGFGYNVAKPYVIRISGPPLSWHVQHLSEVPAARVKVYGRSASLIVQVFKAVFAYGE
jgi:hypothetical protein